MGIRIAYDPEIEVAVLWHSTTGTGLGPVFQGAMAQEQAESFLEYLDKYEKVHGRITVRVTVGPGGTVSSETAEALHGLWARWVQTKEAQELR